MTLALGQIASMLIGSQTAVWQLTNQRRDISKQVATALNMGLRHQTIGRGSMLQIIRFH